MGYQHLEQDETLTAAAMLNLLPCFLCQKPLQEPKVIAECAHSFCRSCIFAKFDEGVTNCPQCGMELGSNPAQSFRPDTAAAVTAGADLASLRSAKEPSTAGGVVQATLATPVSEAQEARPSNEGRPSSRRSHRSSAAATTASERPPPVTGQQPTPVPAAATAEGSPDLAGAPNSSSTPLRIMIRLRGHTRPKGRTGEGGPPSLQASDAEKDHPPATAENSVPAAGADSAAAGQSGLGEGPGVDPSVADPSKSNHDASVKAGRRWAPLHLPASRALEAKDSGPHNRPSSVGGADAGDDAGLELAAAQALAAGGGSWHGQGSPAELSEFPAGVAGLLRLGGAIILGGEGHGGGGAAGGSASSGMKKGKRSGGSGQKKKKKRKKNSKERSSHGFSGKRNKVVRDMMQAVGGSGDAAGQLDEGGLSVYRFPASTEATDTGGKPPVPIGAVGCGPPYAPEGWGWRVGTRTRNTRHQDVYFYPPGETEPIRSMVNLKMYFRKTQPFVEEDVFNDMVNDFYSQYWKIHCTPEVIVTPAEAPGGAGGDRGAGPADGVPGETGVVGTPGSGREKRKAALKVDSYAQLASGSTPWENLSELRVVVARSKRQTVWRGSLEGGSAAAPERVAAGSGNAEGVGEEPALRTENPGLGGTTPGVVVGTPAAVPRPDVNMEEAPEEAKPFVAAIRSTPPLQQQQQQQRQEAPQLMEEPSAGIGGPPPNHLSLSPSHPLLPSLSFSPSPSLSKQLALAPAFQPPARVPQSSVSAQQQQQLVHQIRELLLRVEEGDARQQLEFTSLTARLDSLRTENRVLADERREALENITALQSQQEQLDRDKAALEAEVRRLRESLEEGGGGGGGGSTYHGEGKGGEGGGGEELERERERVRELEARLEEEREHGAMTKTMLSEVKGERDFWLGKAREIDICKGELEKCQRARDKLFEEVERLREVAGGGQGKGGGGGGLLAGHCPGRVGSARRRCGWGWGGWCTGAAEKGWRATGAMPSERRKWAGCGECGAPLAQALWSIQMPVATVCAAFP